VVRHWAAGSDLEGAQELAEDRSRALEKKLALMQARSHPRVSLRACSLAAMCMMTAGLCDAVGVTAVLHPRGGALW
jgi:hypothetical protein